MELDGEDELVDLFSDETYIENTGLFIDGVWGTKTTSRLQELLDITVTGVITGQPNSLRGNTLGTGSGWGWTSPSRAKPDDTLLLLQLELSVPTTGFMDLQTINALSQLVGLNKYKLDPELVKAIQTELNKDGFLL